MGQITIIVKKRSQKSEPEKGSVTYPNLWNEPINKVIVEMRTGLNESKLGNRAWSRPEWGFWTYSENKWKSILSWILYGTSCINWGHKCWVKSGIMDLGIVAHTCGLSYSESWGERITWAQAFKTTWVTRWDLVWKIGDTHTHTTPHPTSWTWWCMPIIPVTWDTEAGEF